MAAIGLAGWSGPTGRTTATLRAARTRVQALAARLRPAALTIAGLGCIDIGIFEANGVAGWIATGVSLLLLEYRIDE